MLDLVKEHERDAHALQAAILKCKNTVRVSLDDVAKDVGLTHFPKSNVSVVVTTSEIGAGASRFANKILLNSNLAIVMLDGADLAAINRNPPRIVCVFNRGARNAMKLKVLEALE